MSIAPTPDRLKSLEHVRNDTALLKQISADIKAMNKEREDAEERIRESISCLHSQTLREYCRNMLSADPNVVTTSVHLTGA